VDPPGGLPAQRPRRADRGQGGRPRPDNLLFSHADRSRVITGKRAVPLPPGNGAAQGTLLVDGLFAGTWRTAITKSQAQLQVTTFAKLTKTDADAVTAEGLRLLAFLAPGDDPDVVLGLDD
jgi:hypothetical protein